MLQLQKCTGNTQTWTNHWFPQDASTIQHNIIGFCLCPLYQVVHNEKFQLDILHHFYDLVSLFGCFCHNIELISITSNLDKRSIRKIPFTKPFTGIGMFTTVWFVSHTHQSILVNPNIWDHQTTVVWVLFSGLKNTPPVEILRSFGGVATSYTSQLAATYAITDDSTRCSLPSCPYAIKYSVCTTNSKVTIKKYFQKPFLLASC